jgi:hypothetical protein
MRNWSIDSLRIRIPLSQCVVLDSELNTIQYLISSQTGEILESTLNTKRFISNTGITTTISITKELIKWNQFELHVVILVNSKSLKQHYFKGISKSTLKQVFEYVMDLNVVHCSFEAFKQAQCTDIDIKTDINCTETEMKATFNVLNAGSKEYKQMDRGVKSSWTKSNKMIQFNKRQNTDFLKAPFLKIYAKSLELQFNSGEFVLNHLSEIPQDTWRIEYTIKNKKHLNTLNMPNTLGELVECSQEQYESAYQTSMRAVLNARIKKDRLISTDISPKDIPMINAIIICLDSGNTWNMLKSNLLGSLEGSNRTKRANYLQDLFEAYIKPIEAYSNHEKIDSVLEQIGYTF